MRTSRTLPVVVAALLLTILAAGQARAAEDEITDMPQGITAKIARMKSKNGSHDRRDRFALDDSSSKKGNPAACGSLNIGNSAAGRAGTRAPKQVIVVIEGPVVNANNKCK
jgi:hypothetical protein